MVKRIICLTVAVFVSLSVVIGQEVIKPVKLKYGIEQVKIENVSVNFMPNKRKAVIIDTKHEDTNEFQNVDSRLVVFEPISDGKKLKNTYGVEFFNDNFRVYETAITENIDGSWMFRPTIYKTVMESGDMPLLIIDLENERIAVDSLEILMSNLKTEADYLRLRVDINKKRLEVLEAKIMKEHNKSNK